MYLYRAINDNDLSTLNLNEGLYSKDITESLKEETFYFLLYANRQLDNFLKLPKEEQKSIYKSYIHDFIFDSIKLRDLATIDLNKINFDDVKSLIDEQKNICKRCVYDFIFGSIDLRDLAIAVDKIKVENIDKIIIEKIKNIYDAFGTINNHLANGTRCATSWISFTKDIHNIEKYYLRQRINKVVMIDNSNLDLNIDCNTLAIDIGNPDKLKKLNENKLLLTKKLGLTKSGFHGFNYSIRDKEVIYYSHIPQEKIITVLNPMEVDLLYNDLLSEKIYKLNNDERHRFYEYFNKYIKILLKDLSDIEEKVLFEHYFNSKSLASLYSDARDADKFISAKKKILSKIPITQVTSNLMKGKCQNIILPEENRYSK
mgnify:FL=1